MSLLRRAMRLGLAALVGLGVSGASCGQRGLAIMPGVINDPANLTLRKAILGFAWSRICPELRARSVPLQLRDTDPAIGRYFATGCAVRELANGNLFVQVLGHGYAWTNITLRIGFEASAAVEYEHDFLLDGSTMYVYLRERSISTNEFKPLVVERQQASGPGAALFGSTVAAASQQIGERVLRSKLAEGFTVVRDPDGTTEFAMGVLEKGRRPEAPFAKGESDWLVLANERTELHHGQRDYAGPFRIEGDDAALYLTVVVEGAPAVDVLVVHESVGAPWLQAYEREIDTAPPPGPAVLDEPVPAGAPVGQPTPWRRMIAAPKGQYYVVFDNTATAGRTQPAGNATDDRAALVSYAVQMGERP